ncbi:MAG: aminomethyl-transferring glycine dehydrogenase subunit GcvPB, partial [Verrucomicrobiota bacterium]|nr:aminomethyl-transferring glycine dehydrogenase subunit GcvPB [Verrucomicrobiota bacterium]
EGFLRISENAIINANYLRARLKPYFYEKIDRFCMHEWVLSAEKQVKENNVRALDIAKKLIDMGYHPPTIYFPLIVSEAMMIEPTETESKQTIDEFIDAMIEIAESAKSNPDRIKNTPKTTPVTRLDETIAARKPNTADLG